MCLHKSFVRLVGHRLLPLFYSWETQLRDYNWLAWGELVSTVASKASLTVYAFYFCPPDWASGALTVTINSSHLKSSAHVGTIHQNTTELGRGKLLRRVCACRLFLGFQALFTHSTCSRLDISDFLSLKRYCLGMWSSDVSYFKISLQQKNWWWSCGKALGTWALVLLALVTVPLVLFWPLFSFQVLLPLLAP